MSSTRLKVLDGWRGLSILLVLLGHLLPIGPKAWQLNVAVAGAGMAIFFTLSGFLITSVLLRDADVRRFLIHRAARILPLAWLAMLLMLAYQGADANRYPPHLLFYANEVRAGLTNGTGHLWSLCVEVQFYVFVALLVATLGRRALFLLPLLALLVTAVRVFSHVPMAIDTQYRVDEILAGCTLALAWGTRRPWFDRAWLGWTSLVAAPLLVLSSHPAWEWLNYVRPYIAAAMVGCTLGLGVAHPVRRWLSVRPLGYLATVSYALYVVHGCLADTWLGSGDKEIKYLKRPLLFLATFALAHLSTRYYERFFIDMGHRWAGVTRRAAEVQVANSVHDSQ